MAIGSAKKLPLMADFVDTLGLRQLLTGWGIDPDKNFEDIFSEIYDVGDRDRIDVLQSHVEEYFSGLEIGDEPTIYDHLLLSLRQKDFIATFNWDPLLLQAYQRSGYGLSLPRLIFLHGNVASGYCLKDQVVGNANSRCSRCGEPFTRAPLLYPISRKNYAANDFIAAEWHTFKEILKHTFMVTIFGYSGPKSDQEALSAMGGACGVRQRTGKWNRPASSRSRTKMRCWRISTSLFILTTTKSTPTSMIPGSHDTREEPARRGGINIWNANSFRTIPSPRTRRSLNCGVGSSRSRSQSAYLS
ncbi:protein of unknown function [Methylocella tundrae]|uniref:SIR2-like domain-containing protein n=1 Tax=Methylocella tundrae TaxID=227605 RepID=A0A4U8Z175_METTU|nr:hypothetical protein [Methylocella tundrae]VFU09031.1 protein of unknown function [Methylocella tundrae]